MPYTIYVHLLNYYKKSNMKKKKWINALIRFLSKQNLESSAKYGSSETYKPVFFCFCCCRCCCYTVVVKNQEKKKRTPAQVTILLSIVFFCEWNLIKNIAIKKFFLIIYNLIWVKKLLAETIIQKQR